MKRLVIVGLMAVFALGCGSDSSSYSAIKNKLDHPTGDLSKDNVKTVAEAMVKAENQKSGIYMGATTQGALTSALEDGEEAIKCEEPDGSNYHGGTMNIHCTCSGGGSLVYTVDPSNYHANGSCSTSYTYNECKIDEGVSDGTGYIYMENCSNAQGGICYEFHGKINSEAVNIEACIDENGQMWYLVNVEGQSFTVRGTYDTETGDGDWYVRDMDGVWHCTAHNGSGSCQGPDGTTIEF
jgi:hypothetical protein